MRYGVLIGSATAVVLLVAASAVVFRGDRADRGTPPRPSERAAPQPAPAPAKPSEPDRAAQQPAPTPPSFDVVKVGPTGLAVIAGRAEPGARVIVRDGDKAIGEVTADRRGEWVLIPDQPIGAGNRLLSAEASNPGIGAVVKSEETVALSINPPPTGRTGETALAVVLPRDGGHGARVLQLPEGASPGQPNALSMDTAEYDAQGKVVLSGHAAPGATVQIYLGNEPLATVTADAAGAWSATSSRAVPSGQLELRLDQLTAGGQVAQRVALPFGQETAMDPAPGQNYVVQRGNSLWRIAQHAYGAGTRYVVIYSANPDRIRNPDKIYPGQIFKIPKS